MTAPLLGLRPFLLGHPKLAGRLLDRCPLPDPLFLDVLTESSLPFFRLLNAANSLAFGSLGMPPWVQLDCCALPSAMVGFALPRAAVPEGLWCKLLDSLGDRFGDEVRAATLAYDGPVPVSEYCALPTFREEIVVGMSLFSLLPGHGLGVRTKAMALSCYSASTQLGITQYSNDALRTHTALGPLTITQDAVFAHSRPRDTFAYELAVPPPEQLRRLAQSEPPEEAREAPFDLEVRAAAATAAAEVAALRARHGAVRIVWPGVVRRAGERWLRLGLG